MKRIIAMLLLVTMCFGLLVACGGKKNPAESDFDKAVKFFDTTYSTDEGKKTPNDYSLIAQIPIGDTMYPVTWTVDNEAIKITMGDKLYNVDVPEQNETEFTYTLTATIKDANSDKTVQKTITRVLPVYNNAGSVGGDEVEEDTAYKLFLVQAGIGKTLFATNQIANGKYVASTEDPKAAADFYIEKVEGGSKFYTEIDGAKMYLHAYLETTDDGKTSKRLGFVAESDNVWFYKDDVQAWFVTIDSGDYVLGTYAAYDTISISESRHITVENSGVSQFPGKFMLKTEAEAGNAPKPPVMAEDPAAGDKTIVEFNEIASSKPDKGATTTNKYTVTGTISEIVKADYGNMYIQDEAGNKLFIYGLYSNEGSVRFDKMNPQPKVGDTIVVTGVAGNYNGPQMPDAWLLKLNGEDYVSEGGSDTPDTPVIPDVPVVDEVTENTTYKFYLTQLPAGKVLSMTAELDQGQFIKGTTDAKAALDFFAEKVEGGYKFYTTIDGAKMYLHAHTETNDAGKISKFIGYAAESDNVWYYKAEVNGWFVTLDGAEYVLGTYNTYETFSMSEARHLTAENTGKTQFPGVLILKTDAESEDAPVIPDTPDTPDGPATDAVIPEAGTAYKLYFIQKNKNNTVYYLTGVLSGFYAATSENAADAVDFTLTATDGGYHLTCTVGGATKYVNVIEAEGTDGKMHINIKFDDAATSVWAIDETLKTVVTTLGETKYIIGTKADGTYTTLGPMKADSGCMYAQFILPGNTPSVPETPDTPDTPDTPAVPGASEIKVDTPYYISGINSAGALYFDGTVSGGRIGGKADKASAVTVKLESAGADGEYYIYFMNGDTKTYIAAPGSKTSAFDLITEKNETAVWIISTADKGIVSKYMGTRGIATQIGSTYNNFSTYATSNFSKTEEYHISWFVEA